MQPVQRRLSASSKRGGRPDVRRATLDERYRALAELTSDFTYELRFEPGGAATPVCFSGRVLPVLGVSEEELDAMRGLEALLHPDDLPRYKAHQATLRLGTPSQAEYRIRTRGGTIRWLRDRACPLLPEGTDEAPLVLGIVQDVTQQQDDREALRLTQASVDHAADAILWLDEEGRFTYANDAACRMLGEERGALLQKHLHDLDTGMTAARWPEYWERLRSRGSASMEAAYRCAGGRTLAVDVTTTYVAFNGAGFCFACVRDASGRKRHEAELIRARREAEEMSRLKSALLANLSHEIRTPLAAIIGFASILIDEVPDEHRRFMGFIERSGKRLLETLNSILNLSMLESGAVQLHREVVHVAREVGQQAERLRPRAEEKGISLELVLPDADAQAYLDRACLDRVLSSLIDNAVKFTEQGGVTVTVRNHPEQVEVAVRDTGVGIDQAFLPDLFSDFKQETMGEERAFEGIGLGLAITKRMLDLMGGSIAVATEKGVGSTFTVLLPRLGPIDDGGGPSGVLPAADQQPGRPLLVTDAMTPLV